RRCADRAPGDAPPHRRVCRRQAGGVCASTLPSGAGCELVATRMDHPPGPGTTFLLPLPPPGLGRRAPAAFNAIKHLAGSMPADGLEAQDVVPPRCVLLVPAWQFSSRRSILGQSTHARAGKAHTLARALSRCSACNHLGIAAGDGHGWLWSVVAEAVVRA